MSNPFLETQYVCNNLLYQLNGDVYMMYKGRANTLCCSSSQTVEGWSQGELYQPLSRGLFICFKNENLSRPNKKSERKINYLGPFERPMRHLIVNYIVMVEGFQLYCCLP